MDRLVNDEDREWFVANFKVIVKDIWNKDFDEVFEDCDRADTEGNVVDMEALNTTLKASLTQPLSP